MGSEKAVPIRPNCATFTAPFSAKWASYTFSHLHLATFGNGIRGGRLPGIVKLRNIATDRVKHLPLAPSLKRVRPNMYMCE